MKLLILLSIFLLSLSTSIGISAATTAWDLLHWRKPDNHLPYPQDRKLNQQELAVLAQVQLPATHTYA
ncbi:MAG: hypothetical protein WCG27_08040, partial [Pseudomonadota bacterium]